MALGVESPTLSKVYIHENLPALCLEPLELSVKPGVENIAPVAHLLELPNAIRRPINFTRQRSVAKHLWPGGAVPAVLSPPSVDPRYFYGI
jgi:hypothetical protein